MFKATELTGIILAGGKSSRFGSDKAIQVLGRERLVERAVHQLSWLPELLVVANETYAARLRDSVFPARLVFDIRAGQGPMGGIEAGLLASGNKHALVVACDMPFLNRGLICRMIEMCPGWDLVVPRTEGLIEPLHAIYSKDCLPAIRRRLGEGKVDVRGLLEDVRVLFLEQEEVDRFDPKRSSFFNINSVADMDRARELARDLAPELMHEVEQRRGRDEER